MLGRLAEIYEALVLGTRDYVEKNGFRHVVIGLSGGIDSALVACVAVDALGADGCTRVIDAVAVLVRGTRATPARSPQARRRDARDRRSRR